MSCANAVGADRILTIRSFIVLTAIKAVLAYIDRQALDDYFRVPGDQRRTLQQWNLVVQSNRAAFEKIIAAKYERGDRSTYNAFGGSYPKVAVTLDDMQGSGEKFADDILKPKAAKAEFKDIR